MKTIAILLLSLLLAQTAENNSATITIYRANQFVAKLKSPTVYCNEAPLAKMQNGRFFRIHLTPGKYAFRSEDKGVGIQLNAEPGKEYYVRIEMAVGTMKATQQVAEVSAEQAEKELPKLKPIDKNKVIDPDKVLLE